MRKSLVIATVAALAWSNAARAITDESRTSIPNNGKELNETTVSLPSTPPVMETESGKRPHKPVIETETGKRSHKPPVVETETHKRSHTTTRTAQPPTQERPSDDTAARVLGTAVGIGLGLGLHGRFGGFGHGGDGRGLRGGDRGGFRGGPGGE